MSRATLKTADRLRRLRELHAAGASTRQIAAALGVRSHRTIGAWLAAAGLEPNGSASRAPRPAAPPPPVATAPSPPSPTDAAAELLADDDEPLPADRESAMLLVQRRLGVVRALLDQIGREVRAGAYPAPAFVALVNCESALAAKVAELAPPVVPDPERDPTNLDAADRVRRKLERLVGAVEERERAEGRCARCGGPLPAAADPSPVTPGPEKRHVI